MISALKKFSAIVTVASGLLSGCSMPATVTNQVNEAPATDTCQVVRCKDGDTVVVKFNTGEEDTVRFIGVDTPETVKEGTPVQFYGPEASDFTKNQLTGKVIKLEYDEELRDQYDRLLAYVWVDSQLFNETLAAEGYARVKTYQPNDKYQERLERAQYNAQQTGKGLWAVAQ